MKEIVVDFKNILSEMKLKEFKLCILRKKWLCIEDSQKNLYHMELYRVGSYLDQLIKDGIKINFYQIDSKNIKDWEKEIWSISKARDFIKRIVK